MEREELCFEPGRVYWTCLPSDESMRYGRDRPHCPYRVKMEKSGYGAWSAYRFNDETGDLDYDTNASAVVTVPDDVFETEEQAADAFDAAVVAYVHGLRREIDHALKDLTDYATLNPHLFAGRVRKEASSVQVP